METKDVVTFGFSSAALIFSLLSIYFSHFHKPSSAVLSMVSRDFSPAVVADEQVILKSKRNIKYCIGNTGRQSLYVKEISMMRGPSLAGNLRDPRSFFVLKCNRIKPFVINPGEVVPFELNHDNDYSGRLKIVDGINNCEMVSLEVLSADGKRYQICHDIGRLTFSDMDVNDTIWNGVPLGRPVHSVWYV